MRDFRVDFPQCILVTLRVFEGLLTRRFAPLVNRSLQWTCCLFGPRGKDLLSAFDTLANWLKENTNPPKFDNTISRSKLLAKVKGEGSGGAGEGVTIPLYLNRS